MESVDVHLAIVKHDLQLQSEEVESLKGTVERMAERFDALEKLVVAQTKDAQTDKATIESLKNKLVTLRYAHENGKPLPPADELRLHVISFGHHDKALFQGSTVPATCASRPIEVTLELRDGNGDPVPPPKGFQVQVDLVLHGDSVPITHDMVTWGRRSDAHNRRKNASNLKIVSACGNGENHFIMPYCRMSTTILAGVYSSELNYRLICAQFSARGCDFPVVPAQTIPFLNMSRLPSTRPAYHKERQSKAEAKRRRLAEEGDEGEEADEAIDIAAVGL